MKFQEFLLEYNIAILDGGMAHELQQLSSHESILHPKLWTADAIVSDPDAIISLHNSYYEAGADIGTTSSYQVSFEGFKDCYGFDETMVTSILNTSVALTDRSRQFMNQRFPRQRPRMIAASLGCYGAHLANGSEYRGNYGISATHLQEWHRRKFDILIENSNCDLLAFETIPDFCEVRSIFHVLDVSIDDCKTMNSIESKSAWVSMIPSLQSCHDSSSVQLPCGTSMEEVFRWIADYEFEYPPSQRACPHIGIGFNCCAPQMIGELLDIMATIISPATYFRVVYPNSGSQWCTETQSYDPTTQLSSHQYQNLAKEWISQRGGAQVIGGCCQVGPNVIRALHELVGDDD